MTDHNSMPLFLQSGFLPRGLFAAGRFLCLGLVFFLALGIFFSPGALCASSLEQDLAKEKQKAEKRKTSLQRLTEEERKANASLADAEKKILDLEKNIDDRQKKLMELAQNDKEASSKYASLVKERERTEAAQAEVLRLLWELTCQKESVGARDMTDWAGVDRNYVWSRDIFGALDGYRKEIEAQERKIADVVSQRNALAKEIQKDLDAVNEQKNSLLQARLKYNQRLADLRKQRQDTETELVAILKLVEDMNLRLEKEEIRKREAQKKAEEEKKAVAKSGTDKGVQKQPDEGPTVGSLAGLKGKLPYPVKGSVKQKYAPSANPPVRGLGFATSDRAEVLSVAAGKVVHNDILRGFGNVVIVMHGSDYYSLYAFLANSPLKVGQSVKARQIIGNAGFYPVINGSGLYFELRFHQKAINPETWFASS